MKLSQVKEFLPFIQALAEGKTVEWQSLTGSWIELQPSSEHFMTSDAGRYRIKPTPTLRPWRPEEVPVGALLRHRTVTFVRSTVTMILSVRGAWIGFVCAETFKLIDMLCENINKHYEHSLDHGRTWLPCGVAE